MNILRVLGLSAVVAAMVGCTSNNNGNTQTMIYNKCFNVAVDDAAKTTVIDDEVAYTLVLDFDDNTIDITAQSLQIAPNGGNATVNFGKIPFVYDNDIEAIKATAASVNTNGYVTVSDLQFIYSFRTLQSNGQYIDAPIITLNYRVNNTTRVTAYMKQYAYVNSVTVANGSDGSYTQSDKVIYTVTFNEPKTQKAVVSMDGVKYAEGMTPQHLVLYNLSASFNEAGYELDADKVIPKVIVDSEEKEATEYTMSDLGLEARFTTNKEEYPVYFTYTVDGKYSVRSSLGYYQPLSSSQN